MQIVADIKASAASESKMYQAATPEILEDFRNTLTKGEEGLLYVHIVVDDPNEIFYIHFHTDVHF